MCRHVVVFYISFLAQEVTVQKTKLFSIHQLLRVQSCSADITATLFSSAHWCRSLLRRRWLLFLFRHLLVLLAEEVTAQKPVEEGDVHKRHDGQSDAAHGVEDERHKVSVDHNPASHPGEEGDAEHNERPWEFNRQKCYFMKIFYKNIPTQPHKKKAVFLFNV